MASLVPRPFQSFESIWAESPRAFESFRPFSGNSQFPAIKTHFACRRECALRIYRARRERRYSGKGWICGLRWRFGIVFHFGLLVLSRLLFEDYPIWDLLWYSDWVDFYDDFGRLGKRMPARFGFSNKLDDLRLIGVIRNMVSKVHILYRLKCSILCM